MTKKYLTNNEGTYVSPFYLKAVDYQYSLPVKYPQDKSFYLPLEIDTEYKVYDTDLNFPNNIVSDILTTQIRAIETDTGLIYAHPNSITNKRHRVFKTEFLPIQYLRDLGYEVDITRNTTVDVLRNLPFVQIDFYAFFALVDTNKIAVNAYRDDIVNLGLNLTSDGIKMERRLRAATRYKGRVTDYCHLPWILTLHGCKYAVRLSIKDTSAVHGNTNYAKFCKNTGVSLQYKDTFTADEKGCMDAINIERPVEFDNYALGDLYNHQALVGNAAIFNKIYNSLNIVEGYTLPRLTIGSTISKLLTTGINSACGFMPLEDKGLINAFCKPASVEGLEHLKTTTAGLCLKVDGGRCRNNRPTDIVVEGAICDLDISGAYTESMREQIYPVGLPVIIDYDPKLSNNSYQTLRKFIKSYGSELVAGLWIARVSLKEGYKLKYPQDFFASWKPPKNLYDLITDTENQDDEWWDNVDNIGVTKVLNHEVTNAVLNHDSLQWIMNVATERQRKELLDNLMVVSSIYYPKSERVNDVNELVEHHSKWQGINTTTVRKVKGKTTKIKVEQQCHKWFGFSLSEIIDPLAIERKKYPKGSSENELYKLTINTIYGVEVSPFFSIGNVVVGNNITARVRTLAWCMEKGLNGFQTITDGCAFDMNRVITKISNGTNRRELSSSLLTHIPSIISKGRGSTKSLADDLNYSEIKVLEDGSLKFENPTGGEILSAENSHYWINNLTMKHLQSLFKGLDVLHKETVDIYGEKRTGLFEFEAKGFYHKGTFQGAGNYMLCFNNVNVVKYRSYPKKPVREIVYETVGEEKLFECINDKHHPAEEFMVKLSKPNKVTRANPFLQRYILKPNEWRKNYKQWERSQVVWGDSIEKVRLLKEFSLSQFTYQTFEQYKAWQREYNGLVRRYGQSYEMFYLNADSTLDYQKMIVDIDERIRGGDMGYFDGVNRHSENTYRTYTLHPAKECVLAIKRVLMWRYKLTSESLPYRV